MSQVTTAKRRGPVMLFLDGIEWLGNKLPDPAVLFVIGIAIVWILSAVLAQCEFTETLPGDSKPIAIVNLLALGQIAVFLSEMTKTFVRISPRRRCACCHAGRGYCRALRFRKRMPQIAAGLYSAKAAFSDGHICCDDQPHRSGCRLRSCDSIGWSDVLCGWQASAGGNRRRFCRCIGRIQR